MFGLLTRQIFLDLATTTALALTGVTVVMTLVLAMVIGGQRGLDPLIVLSLIPYMVPAMLPYTLPTCLLYACTVVYGGMSGANEVTAVKAGGIPPLRLAWPALCLGVAVSATGLAVTNWVIPACNQALAQVILDDLRNAVLAYMKNNGNTLGSDAAKFTLHARQIRGNELSDPHLTIMKDDQVTTQGTLRADKGYLDVVRRSPNAPPQLLLRLINAAGAAPARNGEEATRIAFPEWLFEAAIPDVVRDNHEPKLENLTYAGCLERSAESRKRAAQIAGNAAFANAMQMLAGDVSSAFFRAPDDDRRQRAADYDRYLRKSIEAIGEVHLRAAQSCAGLAFVMLGVPLAILLQRRDALQTFFVCFVPIVTLFYPSMILAFNAFKELRGLENYHSAAWLLWCPVSAMGLFALAAMRKLARS